MRRALLFLMASSVVVAGVVVACKGSNEGEPVPLVESDGGGQVLSPDGAPAGGDDDDGGSGTPDPEATGLPCDVQTVLETRCTVCHSKENPKGPPLVTYDDLKAPSTRDANKSRAVVSVELMKSKAMPQPPAEPAFDDEIADVEKWVKDGMPKNDKSCVEGTVGDAGPGGDGKVDGGLGPDAGACTSGKTAAPGNGPLMRPGEACIACHTVSQGPAFRFAGTVYPTFHDPNNCNGASPPVTVTITGRNGGGGGNNNTVTLPINEAGNFMSTQRLRSPFKVAVTANGKTRVMQRTVTTGDCNSCHTQWGDAGAPGRIALP